MQAKNEQINQAVERIAQRNMEIRTELAKQISRLMPKYRLNATKVSATAEMGPNYLSRLVNDKQAPSLINWLKLLRAFPKQARVELMVGTAFPDLKISDDRLAEIVEIIDLAKAEQEAIANLLAKRERERAR